MPRIVSLPPGLANMGSILDKKPATGPRYIETLSGEQDRSFDSLKLLSTQGGFRDMPKDLLPEDTIDGISDESTLLRFLRAQNYDLMKAYKKFEAACLARKSRRISTFFENIGIADFEETRKMYPHWTGRRDKKGQPIFYLDIEYLSPKNRADFQKSSEELRVPNFTLPEAASSIRGFLPFEYTTRFVLPLCSAVAGRPVTQSIRIIDISKLSMAQALSLLQYIRESGKTLADSYPEIIDRIFLIGASNFFPTIWNLVKGWLEPATASKFIVIEASKLLETLLADIDIDNIPKRYGGNFAFTHGMQPDLDLAIRDALPLAPFAASTAMDLPLGPLKLTKHPDGGRNITAVGSLMGGRRRHQHVAVLKSIPTAASRQGMITDDWTESAGRGLMHFDGFSDSAASSRQNSRVVVERAGVQEGTEVEEEEEGQVAEGILEAFELI